MCWRTSQDPGQPADFSQHRCDGASMLPLAIALFFIIVAVAVRA